MAEEQHGTNLNYNREYTRWGISAFQKIVNGISSSGTTTVSAADGDIISLGAKADAEATTDTGTFSLISLFKRLLTKLSSLLGSIPVTLIANYSSPEDGAVVYASSATLTASGFAFTVDSANCNVMSVHVTNLAGTVTKYVNGHNGVSLSAAANIITIAGVTPFLATDTKYRVAIHYQEKAYDSTLDVNKTVVLNQDSDKYTDPIALVDTVNVAATTTYYPSTSGISIDGYKHLCIQGVTSGGVTSTIEVTNDPAVSPDWLDITKSFYELVTNTTGNTSFIDVSFLLDSTYSNFKSFRIKSITSDATNAVQYSYRLQA